MQVMIRRVCVLLLKQQHVPECVRTDCCVCVITSRAAVTCEKQSVVLNICSNHSNRFLSRYEPPCHLHHVSEPPVVVSSSSQCEHTDTEYTS